MADASKPTNEKPAGHAHTPTPTELKHQEVPGPRPTSEKPAIDMRAPREVERGETIPSRAGEQLSQPALSQREQDLARREKALAAQEDELRAAKVAHNQSVSQHQNSIAEFERTRATVPVAGDKPAPGDVFFWQVRNTSSTVRVVGTIVKRHPKPVHLTAAVRDPELVDIRWSSDKGARVACDIKRGDGEADAPCWCPRE